MKQIEKIIILIISIIVLNVWLFRPKVHELFGFSFRGGDAKSLLEEFAVYGISSEIFYLVGFLKVTTALMLLAGLRYSWMKLPASILMALFMTAAFYMHYIVDDEILKFIPSGILLSLSLILVFINKGGSKINSTTK
tara:strand:- start:305 stop:715 length:411 start_codon:yes stop_codon:yes gene_type:complete